MPRLSEGVLIHPLHSGLNSDSMTSSVIGFYIMTSPISQPNLHYHILIHSTYNTSIYHTEYSRIGNIFHTSSKCQCYVNIVHKYSKLVFINSINIAYYIVTQCSSKQHCNTLSPTTQRTKLPKKVKDRSNSNRHIPYFQPLETLP